MKVKKLLTALPHLRDDDNKLIANIWFSSLKKDEAKVMTAFDFLQNFSNGNYINPESIRRVRQKIQEQNPELRGKSYKIRKKLATEMKQNINRV